MTQKTQQIISITAKCTGCGKKKTFITPPTDLPISECCYMPMTCDKIQLINIKNKMKNLNLAILVAVAAISCKQQENRPSSSGPIYSGNPVAIQGDNVASPPLPKPTNYCEKCADNSTDPYFKCVDNGGTYLECEQWFYPALTNLIGVLNNGHSETTQDPDINMAWCTKYRDTFLAQILGKGQDYAEYYYLISKVAVDSGGLTVSNTASHFAFAMETVDRFAVFSNGADTDVPFPSSYVDDAEVWLNYYRTKSSDAKFHRALDEIESDMSIYADLTNAQIWGLLP